MSFSLSQTLRRWWPGQVQQAAAAPEAKRWVVLDVETTGLDIHHDELLAVAAVAVHLEPSGPRIAIADSFEALVHHEAVLADKSNILLHGIGVGSQRGGAAPAQVLADLECWLDGSPLLAFHAAFDEAMLKRAMKRALRRHLPNPWLDLSPVAKGLHPAEMHQALDDWMAHFGIVCAQRHQAAADALATAELLLRLWPAARRQGCASFAGLQTLAQAQRWLVNG